MGPNNKITYIYTAQVRDEFEKKYEDIVKKLGIIEKKINESPEITALGAQQLNKQVSDVNNTVVGATASSAEKIKETSTSLEGFITETRQSRRIGSRYGRLLGDLGKMFGKSNSSVQLFSRTIR